MGMGRGALAILVVYDVTDAGSLAEAQRLAVHWLEVRGCTHGGGYG
jgi:hypothetical protein